MKKAVGISKIIFGAVLVLSMFICVQPQMALADPPQDVKLAYDLNSQTLTVTITHKSSFPGFHYIKSVEIKKNGIVVSTNTYDKQSDSATFSNTYKIAADKGDSLEATVSCSLSGNKSATLDVGK
ncbi:MAG: hypothetical protein A2031_09550 [Deltaproteobacteria bacterium RBG_19FT_COMBO_43_11]|nr:MAG: hypothetical protein A2W27_10315 [Deltaproteobacteria bacterium RBG_16_44_11]OGP88584.1 MAG: hypothetical protein A2031_09550 [Deltaproteobacteria bacterium RBG_19FT_COMBO_43_11]